MSADPVSLLKKYQGSRSLREYAKKIGISAAYLSDIYNGNREPGWKPLQYLGLEKVVTRVVTYRRISK